MCTVYNFTISAHEGYENAFSRGERYLQDDSLLVEQRPSPKVTGSMTILAVHLNGFVPCVGPLPSY